MPGDDKSALTTPSADTSAMRDLEQDLPNVNGGSLLASAALIGAGLIIEPELLSGALLGAGVIYGLPIAGRLLRPAIRTAIRAGYSVATIVSEAIAGVEQSAEHIVSEARSDYERPQNSMVTPGRGV